MDTLCVAVAYSGGRDSTALLHATLKVAADQGLRVLALHVNHALSRQADAWQQQAQAQCERWARRGWPVLFIAQRLDVGPTQGESIEAWARQARYRALRELALQHGANCVLLAHHRRDQAETLILQALRGAGVAGLAGMPQVAKRDGVTWLRPWLAVPREQIDAYVRRHRLSHVEDDSNVDVRFARNRLRHKVWPALVEAFPHAEATLADAAAWAQEAMACLNELAESDLACVANPVGLNVRTWSVLSLPRRSNALRAWLRASTGRAAPASLVARLLLELPHLGPAEWPLGAGRLRRYRGVLRYERPLALEAATVERASALSIRRAGLHALPGWGGGLQVERVEEGGVPLAWLAHLELRQRSGGEQFQSGLGRPPRGLKKQFQSASVPEWERDGPLIYSGGQLVYVPGLGLDARVIGLPGQAQVVLQWLPGHRG